MEDVRNPEAREKQGDTFGAAVPGQSLTTPPAGNPYERPPEETDPKKILSFAIKRLNEPKVKEEMMDLLLMGIPIETLVKNLTKAGFMQGKFTPDVALLLEPPLTMYMVHLAQEENIPAVMFAGNNEGPEQQAEMNQKRLGVMSEQRPDLVRSMRQVSAEDELLERADNAKQAKIAKEEISRRELAESSDGSFLEMEV